MLLISQVLSELDSTCALIPFITAGYPNLDSTIEALNILDQKGANIIELGIPYSDALADGPVIQESSRVALEQGIYIDQVLYIVKKVSPTLKAPIVVFTYYNPILSRGIMQFVQEIAQAGAKGLIVPDLPLEEADYLIKLCSDNKIELILFVAPTSSKERIGAIVAKSPGCIYLVSSNGVTGTRDNIELEIHELAKSIKQSTPKLVILGFGISNAEQAAKIAQWDIDGIVMGSAFINKLSEGNLSNGYTNFSHFCEEIKLAIKTGVIAKKI
nr:tryptophan synthase alpha subunit [Ahnfeltia fastigiata]